MDMYHEEPEQVRPDRVMHHVHLMQQPHQALNVSNVCFPDHSGFMFGSFPVFKDNVIPLIFTKNKISLAI